MTQPRLSSAIFGIRVLLNERASTVAETKSKYTTDAELLHLIKAWMFQNYSTNASYFVDIDEVEQAIIQLALPEGRDDPDTTATDTDTTYPLLPIKASALWRLESGVFKMLNIRNETSIRPGTLQVVLNTEQ